MDDIDADFAKVLQGVADVTGMDRSLVTIFAFAYLADGEVPLDELAASSGYSLSSVSVKANMLEKLGFLRRARKPHTNKVFVSAERDFGKILREGIVAKQERKFRLLKESLPPLLEKHRARARTARDRKKVEALENYYNGVLKIERVFAKVSEILGRELGD